MKKQKRVETPAEKDISCQCEICRRCCEHKPGWFMPGEVELVAATMGISIESLFETKIGVDWYEGESEIFVLSPATTENEPGVEFPADPRGTCVFLNDKRLCSIYPVRPFECRKTIHDESTQETRERHLAIAVAWKPHKAQIQSLLKHEPESEVFSCFPFF